MACLPPFTLRVRLLLLVALAHLPALRTHEPNLCSALVAALDLVWLKHLVAEVWLDQGSTFTAIDRNGTILAHYLDSERWVGQSVTDAAIVKAVLTRRRGTAEAPGINGVPRLLAFTPLPGTPGAGAAIVGNV